jgi:hypothetical protein
MEGRARRDISPMFVHYYKRGINQVNGGNFGPAEDNLRKALQYLPDKKYSYAEYFIARGRLTHNDLDGAYGLLNNIISYDTLNFFAYEDLLVFEHNYNRNYQLAEYYKYKILSHMPWYAARLNRP